MIKIMDFSMWIQSPSDWGILFLSVLLIGMSKTEFRYFTTAVSCLPVLLLLV
jgi:hypothetical protein